MLEDCRISPIPFSEPAARVELHTFLKRHGLQYEEDIEAAFGIFDSRDVLVGCGCAAGSLLKCIAVEPVLRGQNALGLLISALTQNRFQVGIWDLFVITRIANEALFQSCGLFSVVRTDSLVLLENRPDGPEAFAAQFWEPDYQNKVVGAVVMNCNPFTLGHRGLIEYAASVCDLLHVFVVEEDRSAFPASLRFRMVSEGTADLSNVRVHLSGPYMISAATFPTYFLKENEDAATLQGELDVTLFAERIAPVLHITRRFAGEEPNDPITARYNGRMRAILPSFGIEFTEISRLRQKGQVISASHVRALLQSANGLAQAAPLLPPSTQACLAGINSNAFLQPGETARNSFP